MDRPIVYDTAQRHLTEGGFPADLPQEQAFVPTGMLVGWLIEYAFFSDTFGRDWDREISAFFQKRMTGPRVFAACGGVLTEEMLNGAGNAFTSSYLAGGGVVYFADYREVLLGDLPTIYHVTDTWENYALLRWRIDDRFRYWRAQHPFPTSH